MFCRVIGSWPSAPPPSQWLSNNPCPELNPTNFSHISLRYILLFSCHLCLGFSRSIFLGYLLNFKITPSLIHSCYIPYLSQSALSNHPDYIRWAVQTMKLSLRCFLHYPFSFLLGPDIRLRILFSSTVSLIYSLIQEITFHTHTVQPVILLFHVF